MLADPNTFPPNLPPGFSAIEDEPLFDPARHLALEPPRSVMTLADFGYGPAQAVQFASPVAATTPTRILSGEGLAAARSVIDALQARVVTHPAGDPCAGRQRLYYGTYHSRFLRDLMGCREMTDFLSAVFATPLAAHTMGHLACQVNFGNEELGGDIAHWHHDIVGFTVVLGLHDPAELDGGHFVYFLGPRDEGQRLLDAGRPLPDERIVVADKVPAGHATIMQGSAILHGAQPMRRAGYRCNIVNSYVSRDVRAPDPNRAFFLRNGYPGSPINAVYGEAARHAAWLARAKLGGLLEDLPWSEDRAGIAAALKAAVVDVERCLAQLEAGDLSAEEYAEDSAGNDRWQMTAAPFDPGGAKEG